MRISDWSSDVCSSDLVEGQQVVGGAHLEGGVPVRRQLPCHAREAGDALTRRQAVQLGAEGRGGVGELRLVPERSEERRVGKSVSVRVDLGGRRIMKKKKTRQPTQQATSAKLKQ